MSGLKEICHCGHDKLSHHRDLSVTGAQAYSTCLCMGCDCREYVNEFQPKPTATLRPPASSTDTCWRKPHLDPDCDCDACRAYANRYRMYSSP